jgi:FG-GAP-like repeat
MRNRWKAWALSRVQRKPQSKQRTGLRLETLEERCTPAISVGQNIDITQAAGNEQETSIVINPTNPLNMFTADTAAGTFKYTLDGGATWKDSDISGVLGGGSIGDQQEAWDTFGNLFITYFAGPNGNTVAALSIDGGATFTLSLDTGDLFDQPNIGAASGMVAMDYTNANGLREMRMAPVTGLGQVGQWTSGQIARNDGTFGDLSIGPFGQVMIVYQENNGGDSPARMFCDVDLDGLGPGGFTARSGLGSTNVGSFDAITPQPDRSVDAEMNLAWDRASGRVYLVYTDEIPDESNDTDIFVRFSDDNGVTWSAKTRVNNDPLGNGKAQFLPAIAVDPTTGFVAVTWYDCRNSPGNDTAQIWGTVSYDGGVTWEANVQIAQGMSDGLADSFNFGDYDKMDYFNGVFFRSWADNSNSTGDNPDGAGSGFDIYTAPVTVTPPGGVGGGTITATPNPVDENHPTTLQGAFDDPNGTFQTHVVTIDWGDGNTQTLFLNSGITTFSANHTYLDNQSSGDPYTVKTTIVGGRFFKFSDTVDIQVNNLPPTAAITGAPTTTQTEGKQISIGSKVTDPSPLDTFTYVWQVQKNGVFYANGTSGGISFTPDDQGTYDVFLSVRDDDGGTADAPSVRIFVQNAPPIADGLTNDGPKAPGEAVTISFVNPTDAGADVAAGLKYDYDFDHNGTWDLVGSTSSSAQHAYAANGIYVAAARIQDKDGAYSPTYLTDVFVSDVAGGNGGIITTRLMAAGSDAGAASLVKVFGTFGDLHFTISPFAKTFLGGVRVATGDVNGDRTEDILVANGPGMVSTIKVYDGNNGSELTALSALYTQQLAKVYPATFTSGLSITSGDINRDGFADVVIGPASGARPIEVISGANGAELARLTPFGTAYANGVSLAVGDVSGDRVPDLIVGQAKVSSRVVVLSGTNLAGTAYRSFFAFPVAVGVFVAAGDTNGDGRADVIVGSAASLGFDSRVRVFSGLNNAILKDFVAFTGYRGGVRVATDDLDGDGKADLLLSWGKYSSSLGTQPHLLALKGTTLAKMQDIPLIDLAFRGGVFVG